MKRFSLTLLILMAMSSMLMAQALERPNEAYTIGGISVEGAEYTDPASILIHSGLSVGDNITIPGPEITDAVKKLWKQNIYSDVSIEKDNVVGNKIYLIVKVAERPRIARFSFKGVTNSQAKDLREKITFIRGTIWTSEKERRAIRMISNFFTEKGFYDISVEIEAEKDPYMQNGVEIKINVDKGKRIKINKIRIEGNQEFTDAKLRMKMKTVKEKRWWRVWERSKYLPKEMTQAKRNLIDFYNENGYRDMEIVFDSVSFYNRRLLDVHVKVFEGNQYYFRDISWIGNYKYSTDTLAGILGVESGDVYNKTLLSSRINGDPNGRDVGSVYLDDGYLFFNLEPVEVLVENDSIDIEMRMYEGPQAMIRKIIIEGNTKTSDYVILREVRTLPGTKFSRADLIRSQREILNLGYFNQETMQVVPIPNQEDGSVDIKYVVEEKPSDQLQVQGGWGGRQRDANGDFIRGVGGFVGTVNLAFNNFSTRRFFKKNAWTPIPSGDGQKLSLAVQMNGIGFQNYSISFLEPWVGGKQPNSLGASVYYSVNQAIQQSEETRFVMKTFGTSVDFGKRLKIPDDFFRSYSSLGYKLYNLRNASNFFPGTTLDSGLVNIVSFKQTFDRTNIDAPLFPRSGSQMSFSVELTPPYSLFQPNRDFGALSDADKFKFLEFHKWSFNSTWYFQVFKNLVIKPRIQIGYLGSFSSDYGISPFERYQLGGSGFQQFNFFGQDFISLRGYPDRSLGPTENGATIGGNIMNKYSLELRYPITLTEATPIWLVGFADAGNSWFGFNNYKPFDLKRSAGVGIRIVLPMVGLLGVDWGYGFDQENPNINKSQFHFILGQEF